MICNSTQANKSTLFSDPFSSDCLTERLLTWTVWKPCLAGLQPTYETTLLFNQFDILSTRSCRFFRVLALLTMWPFHEMEKPCTSWKSAPIASTSSLWNDGNTFLLVNSITLYCNSILKDLYRMYPQHRPGSLFIITTTIYYTNIYIRIAHIIGRFKAQNTKRNNFGRYSLFISLWRVNVILICDWYMWSEKTKKTNFCLKDRRHSSV